MKLPIISQNRIFKSSRVFKSNRGFLIVEIMLAFSLFILFTISMLTLYSSMHRLKIWSLKELDKMKNLVMKIDNKIDLNSTRYGNNTYLLNNELFRISQSDYINSWGRDSCNPRLVFDKNKYKYFSNGIDIEISNSSTDIEVRNDIVYLTADSSISSKKDLYIIDAKDSKNLNVISSMNTGPGVSAIEVAGPYIFLAQISTINQMQVIDIHDRLNPKLISQLKLPLPTATTTAPFASSIFYSNNYVFLGTEKWNGAEFSIISVLDIYNPVVVGVFETNTLINDIYIYDQKAYLATSDEKQMRVLDISDKSNPRLIDSFSSSGWQTQQGKVIDYFEENIGLGRTVGGFNVKTNHESFLFSSTSLISSKDITTGVYGMLIRLSNIFLLTHNLDHEFQILDHKLKDIIFDIPLFNNPVRMVCDKDSIFFATGDSKGLSILNLND